MYEGEINVILETERGFSGFNQRVEWTYVACKLSLYQNDGNENYWSIYDA